MKKTKLYYLLIPITLIGSFFSKVNNIFAQEQLKYGPMPVQPMYGMEQPLYGVAPVSSLIWRIIEWLLVIIIPIAIIVMIILGIVKLAKLRAKNRNKNILNVK